MLVIIVSPSLDPSQNVSGVSAVTQFIIDNNKEVEYVHFELGRKDKEKGGWHRIPSIMQKLREWKGLLKRYPNALIHYNFPLSAPSILRDPLFIWQARKMKRRMVIHVHGGAYMNNSRIPFPLNRILSRVFNTNDPVVVLSEKEKDVLASRYKCQNISVLPNCIDLTDAEDFQREGMHSPVTLGYLGRIAESKGMTELLQSCVLLKRRNIPFCLRIAGQEEVKDQYIPAFVKELGDSFIYHGIVSGADKSAFLQMVDLFILPSYYEGLPMCLLESMSFGCVPLTTPVGSIPTLVSDGHNGRFFPVKGSEPIADLIAYLSQHKAEYMEFSKAARSTVFEKFSPTVYVEDLNGIYKTITIQ